MSKTLIECLNNKTDFIVHPFKIRGNIYVDAKYKTIDVEFYDKISMLVH
jgi:hypothetical protein